MPLLKRKTAIAVLDESTEGTEATIVAATHAKYLVENPTFKVEPIVVERNIVGLSFARKQSIITQKTVKITFRTEIVGSGTKDVEPAWGIFLKGCGFKSTQNLAVSYQYDPVSNATYGLANGNVTLTIYLYLDGKVKKAKGCRGTFKIEAEAGKIGHIDWEFSGVYVGVADTALPALASGYDANIPPIVESCTFQVHSITSGVVVAKMITIDVGNVISPRYDVTSANGIKSYIINDRVVKGTIDPEEMTEAEWTGAGGAESRLAAGTVGALTLNVGGAVDGNKFQISAPAATVQFVGVDEADRDGIATSNIDLGFYVPFAEHATNKEIRFTTL